MFAAGSDARNAIRMDLRPNRELHGIASWRRLARRDKIQVQSEAPNSLTRNVPCHDPCEMGGLRWAWRRSEDVLRRLTPGGGVEWASTCR